jgi:hypothetical protein
MPVRRNVYSLSPTGTLIASLRQGIATMKSRPSSNPTSWIFQANIHGTFAPPQPAWNECQHGSFLFLSWHRMYLYWLERILRAASGNPNLALPYWNWTNAAQRALPVAFRQPAAASNSLFVPGRATGMNNGTGQLPESAVQIGTAMSYPNFSSPVNSGESFGGRRVTQPIHLAQNPIFGALEQRPHNVIHGLVGGSGGGPSSPNQALMSWPETAARDPIFWLHHANIDRLWKRWLDQGGARRNPTGNDFWMDHQFNFFDENGNQVSMSGKQVLNTVTQLDYSYDDDPPASALRVPFDVPAADVVAASSQNDDETERTLLGESTVGEEMIKLSAATKRVPLQLRDEAGERVAEAARAEAVPLEERIVLNVKGVQFDDKNPGVTYEVYLNLPEDQDPNYQSPHYVGNIGFFGMGTYEAEEGGHGGHPADMSFDVTDVVRALQERNEWSEGEARVSFVMRGLEPSVEEAESVGYLAAQAEPPGRPRVERVTLTSGG